MKRAMVAAVAALALAACGSVDAGPEERASAKASVAASPSPEIACPDLDELRFRLLRANSELPSLRSGVLVRTAMTWTWAADQVRSVDPGSAAVYEEASEIMLRASTMGLDEMVEQMEIEADAVRLVADAAGPMVRRLNAACD